MTNNSIPQMTELQHIEYSYAHLVYNLESIFSSIIHILFCLPHVNLATLHTMYS